MIGFHLRHNDVFFRSLLETFSRFPVLWCAMAYRSHIPQPPHSAGLSYKGSLATTAHATAFLTTVSQV